VQPLFVFCADLHLDDGAWTTRPAIYGDAYCSFNQIVDYCITHRLPLILGGDILEKKSNSARPIVKLCAGLSRMQAASVPVFYIQGNHEYDRNAPWLSVHPWPVHMHAARQDIQNISVYGLDWLPRGEIQTALAAVPTDTDILVTHQVWKDFMGELGRTECELTDVHHVQTVLAGDFHVTKTVESTNAQGQPIRMLSPGSTAMQDMGETPDKFFFVVGQQDGKIIFEPQPLKTRRLISHKVETQDALDELCAGALAAQIAQQVAYAAEQQFAPEITKPLVRIKFNKALPDAYLRVTTCVSDSAHLFCEAITEKMRPKPAQLKTTTKDDLLDAVEALLGEQTAPYKLATALLVAEEPGKEIDVLFRKFMDEDTHATVETGSEELGTPSPANV
jgi:hypothetical protein